MSKGIALLSGETVVLSTSDDSLVLTNRRIRYSASVAGASELVSITLDSVASVGLVSSSKPALLVLAGIAAIAGLAIGSQLQLLLLVIAVVLIAGYFVTRKTVIAVSSNGGRSILAPAGALGRDECIKFIERVERMKLERQDA